MVRGKFLKVREKSENVVLSQRKSIFREKSGKIGIF